VSQRGLDSFFLNTTTFQPFVSWLPDAVNRQQESLTEFWKKTILPALSVVALAVGEIIKVKSTFHFSSDGTSS
jgi:hypothetical protein